MNRYNLHKSISPKPYSDFQVGDKVRLIKLVSGFDHLLGITGVIMSKDDNTCNIEFSTDGHSFNLIGSPIMATHEYLEKL